MKKFLIVVLMLITCYSAYSQQDAMYTHYMYNTLSINPAYAGSRDALTVTALHRSQWVDFKGAPITQTLTMHTPVFTKNMGLGLSVINDQIGPVKNTAFYIDYAYRIRLNKKSQLGFGLKAGVNMFNADFVNVETDQNNDPSFNQDISNLFTPNFGFGLYYMRERFYAGISTPHLIENSYKYQNKIDQDKLATDKRHYFLIAGTVFNLSRSVMLKPTALVKYTDASPMELDITASFILNNRLLLGAMYRTGDAAGILAGLNITEQFHIGYSFDWSFLNSTLKYNSGSHEIMLRYDFYFRNKSKIRSPRYF